MWPHSAAAPDRTPCSESGGASVGAGEGLMGFKTDWYRKRQRRHKSEHGEDFSTPLVCKRARNNEH